MKEAYIPQVPGFADEPWLGALARNMTAVSEPGYPATDQWAYMDTEQIRERTSSIEVVIDDVPRIVRIIELPEGADAISPDREVFLQSQPAENLLLPRVQPIIIGSQDAATGQLIQVSEADFISEIQRGYAIFDQHRQPLAGQFLRIRQLLSLALPEQPKEGTHGLLGIPTNVGALPRHGFAPVTEVVGVSRTPDGEDLVLAYGRPAPTDGQAEPVWSTISVFGSALDIREGRYSPVAAGMRGFANTLSSMVSSSHEATDMGGCVATSLITDYPPYACTLHTGLEVTPMLIHIPYDPHIIKVAKHIPLGEDIAGPMWLNWDQLTERDGKIRAAQDENRGAAQLPSTILASTTGDYMRRSIEAFRARRT